MTLSPQISIKFQDEISGLQQYVEAIQCHKIDKQSHYENLPMQYTEIFKVVN